MVVAKALLFPLQQLLQLRTPPLKFSVGRAASDSLSRTLVSNYVYALVLFIACCGGALHAVAMAGRKKFGEGIDKYYLEWKWWVFTIIDGCAGFMIWPAMPYVSVQIFAPLIIVTQLGTSYLLGMLYFQEKMTLIRNTGVAFCALGVIGVSLSTSHEAAHFTIAEFWAGWVSTRFIMTNVVVIAILGVCFPIVDRSTFWALVSAGCEGIQYICSRSIVDSIFEHVGTFLTKPAVLAAFVIKFMCILGILHTQQLGFHAKGDLSKFAGIFLCGCTAFMCIEGWAFFGDEMPLSFVFAASAFFTLAGIYLLNQKEQPTEAKDVDAVQDSESNLQGADAEKVTASSN